MIDLLHNVFYFLFKLMFLQKDGGFKRNWNSFAPVPQEKTNSFIH